MRLVLHVLISCNAGFVWPQGATAAGSAAAAAAGAVSSVGSTMSGLGSLAASAGIFRLVSGLQMFAMRGNLGSNTSVLFNTLSRSLQWTNFQFLPLGSSDQGGPVATRQTDQAVVRDATASQRRRLAGMQDDYNTAAQNVTDAVNSSPLFAAVTVTAYSRLLCVGIGAIGLVASHWAALYAWRTLPLLSHRPLPALLVFPQLELMYLCVLPL